MSLAPAGRTRGLDPQGGGAATLLLEEEDVDRGDGGGGDGGGGDDQGGGGGGGGGGDDGDAGDRAGGEPLPIPKLGLWLAIVPMTLLFASLAVFLLGLRVRSETWPPPELPPFPAILWANTFVLAASSAAHVWALRSIRRGRVGGLRAGLDLATLLGALFLAGQVLAWRDLSEKGVRVSGDLYASAFYMLTGTHALHVFVGVLLLARVARRARRGAYAPRRCLGVELAGLYWHFLSVVWFALFALLRL